MDDALMQMLRFGARGYACSQIMMLLSLDKTREDNPGLVRATAGLAYGCGNGKTTCGVLTGACCVIGYFAGKGTDESPGDDRLLLMLEKLNDWFEETYGRRYDGISCQAIVGEAGPEASRSTCGGILAATWAKTVEILSEHGYPA